MPKAGTFKFNIECVAQVENLKKQGCSWNQISASLCISYNQVLNIASRIGIRQTKLVKAKVVAPQPIPRGVPTLPPLPSLLLPMPVLREDE